MKVISEKQPKARKEHECDFCGGKIQKGEIYNYQFNVDGDAYEWKSHLRCDKLCHDLDMYHETYGEGVDSTYFWESVWEYFKDKSGKKIDEHTSLEILDWVIEDVNKSKH